MPEHPHIPPADQFPHVHEPYTQGYAPISTGRRREVRAVKYATDLGAWVLFILFATGIVLAIVGTEWIQL